MSPADHRHFLAAQGWLELGDWKSADVEIEELTPRQRAHPDVLRLRVEIYSTAKNWEHAAKVARTLCRMSPDEAFGHIRLAFALHELKRTQEAFDILLPLADKFPATWLIPYNLACYCCQLGDAVGARDWLAQALRLGNAKEIKLQAAEDPDLAPLWQTGDTDGSQAH